jgi:Flp pilus assembly protein TadD
LAAFYYPGIDHFSHAFMNLHPPQMEGIPDEKFRLYSDVVNGAYRLHDLMLGRLIALAGPETTIVLLSDHGFHSDHLRPRRIPAEPVGPAVQHRDHGILVMAAAGLKQDERVYGAGLLDVTPTVLTLLGLPVGADMPGRVLADAFVDPPNIQTIPSWEELPGADGRHPPGFVAPSYDQSLVMEQFAALGYLNLDEMQGEMGPAACRRENKWNLARSLFNSGRLDQAVELLLELCRDWPERGDFALVLAEVLSRLGLAVEARRLVETIVATDPTSSPARFLRGMAALEERQYGEALEHLRAVGPEYAERADLHLRLGIAYYRLGRTSEAEAALQRAVEVDPHQPAPWVNLARCAVRRRNWSEAEQLALHAIGLEFMLPAAHALLGFARIRLNRKEDADLALRVACRQAPRWLFPRRLRAWLWRTTPGDEQQAADAELRRVSMDQPGIRERRLEFASESRRAALEDLRTSYSGRFKPESASAAKSSDSAAQSEAPPLDLVIVTGLPRSGTSLVMQMLERGGAAILTDQHRAADEDNPEGYLEWEAIKKLPNHPELLRQADGKVVKIVTPLLPYLPSRHHYRIIFLDRPIDEIVASQSRMRDRRGQASSADVSRLHAALSAHKAGTLAQLRRSKAIQLLVVPYPELVDQPSEWSARIAAFVGDQIPCPEKMAGAVRPDLYRNRLNPLSYPEAVSGANT